jgi:hypothetical protein
MRFVEDGEALGQYLEWHRLALQADVLLRLCCYQTTQHWHTGSSPKRVVEASSDRPVEAFR